MATTRIRQGIKNNSAASHYDRNVFINCPFDQEYKPLLRPLLFTVVHLGFNPRIALESKNSGAPRIEKILRMIRESLYAIHDLSRNKAKRKGELYRLNMPFELGLDVGCQRFSAGKYRRKKCLILDSENYRYQAALSDIAGSDIENHRNEPREVVVLVRNWLSSEASIKSLGPTKIWDSFNEFADEMSSTLKREGFLKKDIEKLPASELMTRMRKWCERSHPIS